MANVQIYTTPTCAYCRMSKEYFKKNNIEYTEHDVMVDADKRQEMIERTGQMGVPVIDIDGQIIIGFDRGKIDKALDLN